MIVDPKRRIAAIAPSSAYDPARLAAGIAVAKAHGYDVELFEGSLDPHFWLAAPDARRLAHLHEALADPAWGAVWLVRGGQGMLRLLPGLPALAAAPRPVIGFSDATALLAAVHQAQAGPAIHGPMLHSLPSADPESIEDLFGLFEGRPLTPLRGEVMVPGTASGPLVGGNLSLLASLCGTPWQVSAKNAILVVEDVGEPAYRIDRMWSQLVLSGALTGVAGIAFGQFDDCRAGPGWTLSDLLSERVAELAVPVAFNLPIGHGAANRSWVVGSTARLVEGTLHR